MVADLLFQLQTSFRSWLSAGLEFDFLGFTWFDA